MNRLSPGSSVSLSGTFRQPGRYQRRIRYGDDLLLVNVRNGRVVQAINNRY